MTKKAFLWKIFLTILITLTSFQTVQAQIDFKVYMANNVGDVSRVSRLKEVDSELKWKEISDRGLLSNRTDVEAVKNMFKATSQKTRTAQELFWKMRDDNLLCFRINDGKGTSGEFEARVVSGAGRGSVKKNVSNYFFVNTNSANDSIFITINRKGCSASPADTLHFRYDIFDWDNDDLLLFKLDSRRRNSALTYKIELVTEDITGKITETTTLDLKGSSFQSFYRPKDRNVKEVYLVSNGNRLKLDNNRLMWGANLSDKLNRLWMSTNFTLDKHKNRELTLFNMLGSGLFEKFDTLYLRVTDNGGKAISCTLDAQKKLAVGYTFHIVEVDDKGKAVTNSGLKMEYVGCDATRGIHKILTYGKPCYIEVMAPEHYPAVFKYEGAMDPKTKELNKNKTEGKIRLIHGTPHANEPDISEHFFYCLEYKNREVEYDGTLHRVFAKKACPMGQVATSGFLYFIEDGGYQKTPKLLDNKPVNTFAEMSIAYSVPKGQNASSYVAQLQFEEVGSEGTKIPVSSSYSLVLDGNEYPGFERSYYDLRWNMVGVLPKLEVNYKPRLTIDTKRYDDLPMLRRGELDELKKSEEAKTVATKYAFQKGKDLEFNGMGSFSVLGQLCKFDLRPASFPGMEFSIIPFIDPIRGFAEFDVNFSFMKGSEAGSKWQKNMKNYAYNQRSRLEEFTKNDTGNGQWGVNLAQGANTSKKDKDHWALSQMDDIFKVERNKLGYGPFMDLHMGFGFKFHADYLKEDDQDDLGFYVKSVDISGGYGGFFSHYFKPKQFFNVLSFRYSIQASGQARIDAGFKSFNFTKNGFIKERRLGFFLNIMLLAKIGGSFAFGTDFKDDYPENEEEQQPGGEVPGGDNPGEVPGDDNPGDDNPGGGQQGGNVSIDEDIDDDNAINRAESRLLVNRRAGASAGEWANRFFTAELGARIGGKFQFEFGTTRIANRGWDWGFQLTLFAGIELYGDIKIGPVLRFNPRWVFRVGRLWPLPDSDTNPTIPGYPNYKPAPKAARWRAMRAPGKPVFPLGRCVMEGLNNNARPFFTDTNFFLMEDGDNGADMNHDRLAEYVIPAEGVTIEKSDALPVSEEGKMVQNHHFDREMDCSMTVYEEMTRPVDPAAVDPEQSVESQLDQSRYIQIASSLHSRNTEKWVHHVVAYDETLHDTKPVVAVNSWTEDNYSAIAGEDDEAVCVWKRGHYVEPPFDATTATEEEIKHHNELVADGLRAFEGDLMLSIFDGEKWGAPESIVKVDKEDIISDYQILMRNDTVLATVLMMPKGKDEMELRYYSKPYNEPVRYIDTDKLKPVSFSLDMVGAMPTIAILNQVDSVNKDVYIKEIDMMGRYKGYGTDLAIARYNPETVKILVDKDNEKPEDFAVLWKCCDKNIYRDGKVTPTDSTQTMLNCSRIFMRENMTSIPHITLGCTADSTVMSGYTATLDGLKVKTLYTLTDIRDLHTYLMMDQVEFGYDFSYGISYSREAMINSDVLPVNLTVYNTGATPITHLEAYINNESYALDDIFVNPYSTQTFVLEYDIPENFDGLLKAHDVMAVFEDTYIVSKASRRRGAPMRRVEKSSESLTEYAAGHSDLRCEVLGHTIEGTTNKVYLELTDIDELNDNETVHVGLYTDHSTDVPITSTAEVLLKANDFALIGDNRKAYVELTVDGLQEEQSVEVRARVYNDKLLEELEDDDDVSSAIVNNLSWQDNVHVLNLLPTELDNVTLLPVVELDKVVHKAKVETTEQGVWISGLERDDYVRIFDAAGKPVFLQSNPTSRLFVPLTVPGVYLLSTGQEIVKFRF